MDYVWSNGSLHELIGKPEHYDYIFSSHNIEHQTDFLGHLISCSILLKAGGVLVMAVPYMRFTFDAMRNPSTTGEVLKAYHERRARHCPSVIFDGSADAAHLGTLGAWYSHQRGPLILRDDIEYAKALFDRTLSQPDQYLDAHGWCFTPTSFRLVVRDLHELGLCDFKVKSMRELGHLEFHVVLSRDAEPDQMSRDHLKRHLIKERAISAVQLLGGSEDLRMRLFHDLSIHDDIEIVL